MPTKKIWSKTSRLERILQDLEKDGKYSGIQFSKDISEFLKNENDLKFGKHSIVVKGGKVWSIILGYDLRTLYFMIDEKDGIREYIFFDIGDHDHVYDKKINKKFRIFK